jgi:hypothetical protein
MLRHDCLVFDCGVRIMLISLNVGEVLLFVLFSGRDFLELMLLKCHVKLASESTWACRLPFQMALS